MTPMIRSALVGVAVVVLTSAPGFSEGLTVEMVVTTALARHPSIGSASYERTAAEAELDSASSRPTPEISIAPTILGQQGTGEAVVIAQQLEINGARKGRTRAARGGLQASVAALKSVQHQVARDARVAYWDAVLADVQLRVDQENLDHAMRLLAAAEKGVQAGNQPKMHTMKASVEVARARQQVAASTARAAEARALLNAAMGVEAWEPITLPDSLPVVQTTASPDRLTQHAEANRPEVLEAAAAVEQAKGIVDVADAARKPDVAVQYWREEFTGPGGVGLTFTIPNLDWGGLRAERRKSQAELEARRRDLDDVRNTVRAQVAVALAQLDSAQAQARELGENVLALSQQLQEITVIGYEEGATTFLDVLEARRALRDVSLDYQTALADHLRALAELMWAVGAEPEGSRPPGLSVQMIAASSTPSTALSRPENGRPTTSEPRPAGPLEPAPARVVIRP